MNESVEQNQLQVDFYRYPSVGRNDWRYTFATAQVRALETRMLSFATLLDMVNSENFEQAVDMLASTEYALPQGSKDFAEVENILGGRRTEVRGLFRELIIDEPIEELLLVREDFANMRLALRRKLTAKPLGTDYSNDGSIPADQFEEIFEEENYAPLPIYMQEAIEEAVLAYYQNKDVRQIDYALDRMHYKYKLEQGRRLENVFLLGLFGIQIDLINIRTMLRLKFTESEERNVFVEGGFLEIPLLKHALDSGYESIAPMFFATAYYDVVEAGVSYLVSERSFLKLEQKCNEHMRGFLKTTAQITAGPQPVIAYLLMKESEIRTVRLILTAKKNALDTKLILDCIGE